MPPNAETRKHADEQSWRGHARLYSLRLRPLPDVTGSWEETPSRSWVGGMLQVQAFLAAAQKSGDGSR